MVDICERVRGLLQEVVGNARMEVIRSSLYEFDADILSDKQIEAFEKHLATCANTQSELSRTLFRMEQAVGAAFYLGLTYDELPEIRIGEPTSALMPIGLFKLDRRTRNIVENVVRDKAHELLDDLYAAWGDERPGPVRMRPGGVSAIKEVLLYKLGALLYEIACYDLEAFRVSAVSSRCRT